MCGLDIIILRLHNSVLNISPPHGEKGCGHVGRGWQTSAEVDKFGYLG